jgi:proteasomal ATPase-associated factor 1
VAPDASRYATGFLDGSVLIYPTRKTDREDDSLLARNVEVTGAKTISRPHLSGVQSLKFFPSSQVILSSGLDFSLSVLPATLSEGNSRIPTRVSPVRTLRAHTRTVTDTAIIGLGRNVLSASLDSTVKLWEVSSGDVLASLPTTSGVNRISLGERPPAPPDGEPPVIPSSVADAREQPEVASKVVFCALQSGSFELLDLGVKKSVFVSPRGTDGGALSSIVYDEANALLATGSARGTVCVYDVRALAVPVTSFRRLETAIQDLVFVHRPNGAVDLAVATSDGLPYVAGVVPEGPSVRAELVGPDCDPVKNVVVRSAPEGRRMELWTSSDDSIVRRYLL